MLNLNAPGWFKTAPCVGKNQLFFSANPSKRKMAASICKAECEHSAECLNFALEQNITIGVWGGRTGPDLARLVKSSVDVTR